MILAVKISNYDFFFQEKDSAICDYTCNWFHNE